MPTTKEIIGYLQTNQKGIYRLDNDKLILGVALKAYIHNLYFYIADIKVYADGLIDCWGLVNLEQFKEKAREGWVVTQIPDSAEVEYDDIASMTVSRVESHIELDEFVKEVEDAINALNGETTASQKCREAFTDYTNDPSWANKAKLSEAYYAVPKHNRVYILGDMDYKDARIKDVLEI